jgi:hypothetical protein
MEPRKDLIEDQDEKNTKEVLQTLIPNSIKIQPATQASSEIKFVSIVHHRRCCPGLDGDYHKNYVFYDDVKNLIQAVLDNVKKNKNTGLGIAIIQRLKSYIKE